MCLQSEPVQLFLHALPRGGCTTLSATLACDWWDLRARWSTEVCSSPWWVRGSCCLSVFSSNDALSLWPVLVFPVTWVLLIVIWMLLLPGLMTFLALPKPQGRKHTNTITMPVLSKLISTYGKRLSGCSSFGLGLLFLAGWQQSGLLCFAEPSLGFLNPMLVSHCSASVFSSHP